MNWNKPTVLTGILLVDRVWVDALVVAFLIYGLALVPTAQGVCLAIAKLDPYRSTY